MKGKRHNYTGCPTTYQTRHLFDNSKTIEDIATRFEQEYVRCVRNEEECVCSVCLFRCNIFISFRIIKEMPGLVGSGIFYIFQCIFICIFFENRMNNILNCIILTIPPIYSYEFPAKVNFTLFPHMLTLPRFQECR